MFKYKSKELEYMVSISEIIKAFKMCYNSLEICSVIYTDGTFWRNVLTSFYVSKEISETPQENVVFDGDSIKVLKLKMNFSKLHKLLEGLKTGQIKLHNFNVQFENPFDYDGLNIREDMYAQFRQTENARTFVYQRNFNVFNNNDLLVEHMNQANTEIIKLGFIDVFDFITHHTGIRRYTTSSSYDFLMIVPVYFSINSSRVESGILNISLIFNDDYKDLQVNVFGYTENLHTIFREFKHVSEKKNVCIPVKDVLPDSKFEIYLFSLRLPELQIKETIWMPINQPLLPFTQVYNQFHNLEELEAILSYPESLDSKSRSELYEKAVCDLFSLCGLSTVHLRDHEVLQLENKTEIGSADILAYDGLENLFVIDCDILVPDPKKIVNLIHLCRYLGNMTIIKQVKNIIPVIVSPNPSDYDNTDVLFLGGTLVQRMLKGIHYKSKQELVSMITEQYFRQRLSAVNRRILGWR